MWVLLWQRTCLTPSCRLIAWELPYFISLYGVQIERTWGDRDISGNSKVNIQLNPQTWNTIFCYMFGPRSSLFFSRWKEGTDKGMYIRTCTDLYEFMYRLLLEYFLLLPRERAALCRLLILTSSVGSFSCSPFASTGKITCSCVKIFSYFISEKPYHANLLYCS